MQFQVVSYSIACGKNFSVSSNNPEKLFTLQPYVSATLVNEVKKIETTVQRTGTSEEGWSDESQGSERQPLGIFSGNPGNVSNVLGFQQDVRCEIRAVLLNSEEGWCPKAGRTQFTRT